MHLTVKQVVGVTLNMKEAGIAFVSRHILNLPPTRIDSVAPDGLAMLVWLFDCLKGKAILGEASSDGMRIQVMHEFKDELLQFERSLLEKIEASQDDPSIEMPIYELIFLDTSYALVTGRQTAFDLARASVTAYPDSFWELERRHINLTTMFMTRLHAAQILPTDDAEMRRQMQLMTQHMTADTTNPAEELRIVKDSHA